jgi:hypothetical protein
VFGYARRRQELVPEHRRVDSGLVQQRRVAA